MKKLSKKGYKKDSPDKDNPYNIIPSGNITMDQVSFPVYGIDNLGNNKIMYPRNNYQFPGSKVLEIPLKGNKLQLGGNSKSSELSDEDIEKQNKNYLIQRINEVGIDGAIKEYQKHFNTPKRKYSIRKK